MEDRGDIFASLSMHVAVYFGNCVRERPLFSTDFLFGLGWVGGLQPEECSEHCSDFKIRLNSVRFLTFIIYPHFILKFTCDFSRQTVDST